MYNRPIYQENEESISLHEGSEVQEYPNLDSSYSVDQESVSAEESLNSQHRQELERINRLSNIRHQKPQRRHQPSNSHHQRRSSQGRRDFGRFQSKYDFDLEPSTKEQYSLLRPQNQQRHRLAQPRRKQAYNISQIELNRRAYQENYSSQSQQNRHEYVESRDQRGRQARLGHMTKKPTQFKIDSFLNAKPLPPTNKRGQQILGQRKQKKRQEQRQPITIQPQTIELMTIPEIEQSRQERMLQILNRNQKIYLQQTNSFQHRFASARFNFFNTFLPQSSKINNPYNMLKYIQSKK